MTKITTTPRRVYAIHHIASGTTRLVRASNAATALRHVVRSDYSAEVASQDDLIELLTSGTRVEDAGTEDEPAPVAAPAPAPVKPQEPDLFEDAPAAAGPTPAADHVEEPLAMVQEVAAEQPGEPAQPEADACALAGAEPACLASGADDAPADDKLAALLADAYRLGLNEAGLSGNEVGTRAFEMKQGLYITDADAVQAEFVRGCSGRWRREQAEQQVQDVLDSRVRCGASGQAGEDVEHIRAAVAEAAKARVKHMTFAGLIAADVPTAAPAPAEAEQPTATDGDLVPVPTDESALTARKSNAFHIGLELGKRGLKRFSAEMLMADADLIRGLPEKAADEVHCELLRGFDEGKPAADSGTREEIRAERFPSEPKGAGRKVGVKYRDPSTGSTWSGRGLKPRWMVQALEDGRTQDEFLIDGAAA